MEHECPEEWEAPQEAWLVSECEEPPPSWWVEWLGSDEHPHVAMSKPSLDEVGTPEVACACFWRSARALSWASRRAMVVFLVSAWR